MITQETFTKVAKHLLAQNARAENYSSCMYKDHNGLRCAVGCLIEDEHYSYSVEGLGVFDREVKEALRKSGIEDQDGLLQLQKIHDGHEIADWRNSLIVYAKANGFEIEF